MRVRALGRYELCVEVHSHIYHSIVRNEASGVLEHAQSRPLLVAEDLGDAELVDGNLLGFRRAKKDTLLWHHEPHDNERRGTERSQFIQLLLLDLVFDNFVIFFGVRHILLNRQQHVSLLGESLALLGTLPVVHSHLEHASLLPRIDRIEHLQSNDQASRLIGADHRHVNFD